MRSCRHIWGRSHEHSPPRLGREAAREIIAGRLGSSLAEVAAALPDRSPVITYSPVGGARMSSRRSRDARGATYSQLAREHGFPGQPLRLTDFEGACARLLHARLPMTPHEASHEEVWSYLTCCWLLDVALWRFGNEADERRFVGNVNRNTFRRLWWRAEILGPDIDLGSLGEDELVNIMERPTIAGDRRLARAIAREFLARVEGGGGGERMQLMREAMKRVLRLTPFVAFPALSDVDLEAVVTDTFAAAVAGLEGRPLAAAERGVRPAPSPSPIVIRVEPIRVDVTGNGRAADTSTGTRHRGDRPGGARYRASHRACDEHDASRVHTDLFGRRPGGVRVADVTGCPRTAWC